MIASSMMMGMVCDTEFAFGFLFDFSRLEGNSGQGFSLELTLADLLLTGCVMIVLFVLILRKTRRKEY